MRVTKHRRHVLFGQTLERCDGVDSKLALQQSPPPRRNDGDIWAAQGLLVLANQAGALAPPTAGEVWINICWQFSSLAAWKAMKAHTKRLLSPKHY